MQTVLGKRLLQAIDQGSGVVPRNIYKILSQIYRNIARYYMRTGDYDPLDLSEMNECDEITPADVFDLVQVITAELKVKVGAKSLDSDSASRYAR